MIALHYYIFLLLQVALYNSSYYIILFIKLHLLSSIHTGFKRHVACKCRARIAGSSHIIFHFYAFESEATHRLCFWRIATIKSDNRVIPMQFYYTFDWPSLNFPLSAV
jgi:hypothetical protein